MVVVGGGGGQGKGSGLSLRRAVKHLRHVGGRRVAVGIPSDLSTSAVTPLMLDDGRFQQLEDLSHTRLSAVQRCLGL